jgi:hypothetical protein
MPHLERGARKSPPFFCNADGGPAKIDPHTHLEVGEPCSLSQCQKRSSRREVKGRLLLLLCEVLKLVPTDP